MRHRLMFWFGLFLLVDAGVELYLGNFRYNDFVANFTTMNSSIIQNLIILIRGGIGLILMLSRSR
jgi:hypothetical protein